MNFYQSLKSLAKKTFRRIFKDNNFGLSNLGSKKSLIIIASVAMILVISVAFIVFAGPGGKGVSRAEFSKKIVQQYNIPLVKKSESARHFVDVPKTSDYFVYIETAFQRNLIKPLKGSNFYPNARISDKDKARAQRVASRIKATNDSKPSMKFRPQWLFAQFGKLALGSIPTQSESPTVPYEPEVTASPIKPAAKKANAVQLTSIPAWVATAKKTSVTATGNFYLQDSSGVPVIEIAQGGTASIAYSNGVYVATVSGGKSYSSNDYFRLSPKLPAVLEVTSYLDKSYNGKVNYNRFRGDIVARYSPKSKKMWVVNELTMDDYVKGIAEASTADNNNIEYLKILVVAVRSYATHYAQLGGKHAGEPFDLKNSRRKNGNDQVYAGYTFESLIPNMATASEATAGEVMTYKGKVAKVPFSSGTDGTRTRSAKEGWGVSDMPWAAGAPDPYGYIKNWNTLEGNHRVGLSTAGARGYIAKEKRDYKWVLKHYFTGVEIGKVNAPNKVRVALHSY